MKTSGEQRRTFPFFREPCPRKTCRRFSRAWSSLNTDNRLMSSTTMTREFEAAADTFGLSLDDFEKITINAMKSAFLPYQRAL
jgi:hypothetical protein